MGWVNPLFAPPPTRIATVLFELLASAQTWAHFWTTMLEALGGLVIGVVAGSLLGLAASVVRPVADLLEPAMALLNAIPRIVLAPLFVIWFGIGIASKIALSFLLVAVVIFFAVYSGIREVDPRLVDRILTLGGRRMDLVREVYLPSLAAWLFGGLKVATGFAFTGAVVGEFVASSRGLGYLLSFAQSTYNASLTMALIVLVVSVVLGIFSGFERLERRVFRWKPALRQKQTTGLRDLLARKRQRTIPAMAARISGRSQPGPRS
ncbi:MAG: ABC transporter permease [Armatimonadota bacterium]|nr:ABC transporter permease [Armatimonadota bacterium]